jgi:predicted DNA-binding transcriptional regulator AlpA
MALGVGTGKLKVNASPFVLTSLPTLAIIRERPDLAATLPLDAAQQLLAQATADLLAAQTARDALLLRLVVAANAPSSNTSVLRNRTLNTDEIAAALGISRRQLFRNLKKLRFVKRVSRKALAADEAEVLRWRALQKP